MASNIGACGNVRIQNYVAHKFGLLPNLSPQPEGLVIRCPHYHFIVELWRNFEKIFVVRLKSRFFLYLTSARVHKGGGAYYSATGRSASTASLHRLGRRQHRRRQINVPQSSGHHYGQGRRFDGASRTVDERQGTQPASPDVRGPRPQWPPLPKLHPTHPRGAALPTMQSKEGGQGHGEISVELSVLLRRTSPL